MRRRDKEITDVQALEAIIQRALVCRVAFCDHGAPYIVPMSFGYEARTLYLHSVAAGRKFELFQQHPRVCVEFDLDVELIQRDRACDWGLKYRSVIGMGDATVLVEPPARQRAFDLIMQHYAPNATAGFTYAPDVLAKTAAIKVDIVELTGKVAGYALA